VRAIVATQKALIAHPNRAAEVGKKLFPPAEAELIAELIRRDTPYYDASISRNFVSGMNAFARDMGLSKGDARYENVVAVQSASLWAG
jgi:NitT/TauT family transport system substrate-binding protein